jgi:hypothetical protein
MPAIAIIHHSPSSPLLPRQTPALDESRDWTLLWILITHTAILALELVLALAWIRIHNLRSKARWRRLRERGVVVVSGAAMIWAYDLPLRRGVSYFDVRRAMEMEGGMGEYGCERIVQSQDE